MAALVVLCAAVGGAVGVAGVTSGVGAAVALPAAGLVFGYCSVLVTGYVALSALACVMTPDCNAQAQEWAAIIREQGTLGGYGDLPTWDQLKDWIKKWPWIPIPPVLELLRRLTDIHVNWPGGNPFDDLPEPDDDGSWRCSDLTKWARDKGWELKEDGARAFRATDPTGQFMMVIR
jgi:hypothetical protein